ncbi:bacteriocin [Vibrio vulnificus]|nr:bacteriocin [Vibrio vulnificus]EHH0793276.1 bacteriocin [Vibrio vulnificus]EHH0796094.1 bacteriocin [Vibrio vulnificus]EIZ1049659.1 bacteriocin [Vibrio vulnificus]EIZ1052238.1 bacteriocin [Vibrio vulnificus]
MQVNLHPTRPAQYVGRKSIYQAVGGTYLVDMNGRLSINHVQRLPNKLAVVFGNSTVEVSEQDIKVIGRIAATLRKE